MNKYSTTYSEWKLRQFWSTKAVWAGMQTVITALALLAALAMTGFQPHL